jgi:hypothetical protein
MTPSFEQIKDLLFGLVTFNFRQNYLLGGITASLAAFPLIMLGRALYHLSADLYYNSFMLFAALFVYTIYFVLESLPTEKQNTITANRIIGLLITYFYIPMQFKFIILSILVFHLLRSVLNQTVLAHWSIDLAALSGLFGVFALDICAGICANIGMHILRIILA